MVIAQNLNSNDRNYMAKGLYGIYLTDKTNIVMLGDSLTYNANWDELLGRNDVVNRGIPGDNTEGILDRMEYVYNLNPRACFLMMGVNDFFIERSETDVFNNYKNVIAGLREHEIVPIVQSTLYLNPTQDRFISINEKIKKLNGMLKEYSEKNNVAYIDINDSLLKEKEGIYYGDGIHILGKGYYLWREKIKEVMNNI
ncbi:MAG: GDSL family lipase [Parcubacteria group bacterium GW2011_GWD2_38_11]|nr:MAG: GDSL family lipase [Parcubacteria group bacterium GW2011_GWD2_38_11]